jgi:two-component system NtrC family sensor kinase
MAGLEDVAGLHRALRSAEEREAALRDVIHTIARSGFDLEVVLQTVIDRASVLCDADHGNVALRKGDVYRVIAFRSVAPEYERLVRKGAYVPERGSVIGRTALERRVVHIVDVLEDPEYALPELQRAGGYRTVLGVPLLRDAAPDRGNCGWPHRCPPV